MRTWLAECYLPGTEREAVLSAEASVRDAVADARAKGAQVTYLGALFVADDEAVFHVFQADEAAPVRAVVGHSGIAAARIVEAEAVPRSGPGDPLDVLVDRARQGPSS